MIAIAEPPIHRTGSASGERVRVELGERSYEIVVAGGALDRAGVEIAAALAGKAGPDGRTAAILVNPAVHRRYGMRLESSLTAAGFNILTIPVTAGETHKTLRTVSRIFDRLYEHAVDRRTVIVALGGGVIGDVAGYVAASYQRGLDLVQVPTTLLAQVDSSVGGKTGVNFGAAKNLIGAFHQPRLVLIDPDTLRSLPLRERRSGMAEVIKYGVISDAAFYDRVSLEIGDLLNLTSGFLDQAIAHSCRIKARVVEADERDLGLRAILNFGHTVGHALEAVTGYRVYRHGEAIALGMVSACLVGEEMGITGKNVTGSLVDLLRKAGFAVSLDPGMDPNAIICLLALDKKAIGGAARFVLAPKIGEATPGHLATDAVVRSALARQRLI
jgi:3-dehydroquinate synthase